KTIPTKKGQLTKRGITRLDNLPNGRKKTVLAKRRIQHEQNVRKTKGPDE
ncbi:8290_t:CDS:1, partial [Scutellospora calospora]